MQFTALLTTALMASIVSAAFTAVAADVKGIATLTKNLNTSIQKADGKNVAASLAINEQVEALIVAINHATVDTNAVAGKATAKEASGILSDLTKAEKSAKAATTKIIADKKNYIKTGVRGVVEADLSSLESSVKGFSKAYLKKTAAASKEDSKSVLDAIVADIDAAKKAYK